MTSLNLNKELVMEARKRGINLSQFCNRALANYLGMTESEVPYQLEINHLHGEMRTLIKQDRMLKLERRRIKREMIKIMNKIEDLERTKQRIMDLRKKREVEELIYTTIKANVVVGAEGIYALLKQRGVLESALKLGIDLTVEYIQDIIMELI